MTTPLGEKKTIILEKEFPNPYNTPTAYDVPATIQWFLDGINSIEVYPERKRVFLYFAAVNGLLTINSDGKSYVAGMLII